MQSINRKAALICDLISKQINILTLTETWLSDNDNGNITLAEILNTLKDHQFVHLPCTTRKGGGVGVLQKGFDIKKNSVFSFTSVEYMDLSIASRNVIICFIIVHRPPPSQRNKQTVSLFLKEFPTLLEHLAIVPGHLIFVGDFNFHMDDTKNLDMINFSGLRQKVSGPTHKCSHT